MFSGAGAAHLKAFADTASVCCERSRFLDWHVERPFPQGFQAKGATVGEVLLQAEPLNKRMNLWEIPILIVGSAFIRYWHTALSKDFFSMQAYTKRVLKEPLEHTDVLTDPGTPISGARVKSLER